jgi:hypothetical protein
LSAEAGTRGVVGLAAGTRHPAVTVDTGEWGNQRKITMDGKNVTMIRDASK